VRLAQDTPRLFAANEAYPIAANGEGWVRIITPYDPVQVKCEEGVRFFDRLSPDSDTGLLTREAGGILLAASDYQVATVEGGCKTYVVYVVAAQGQALLAMPRCDGSGISPRSGNTPGSAECCIFELSIDGVIEPLMSFDGDILRRTIYNPHDVVVPNNVYTKIHIGDSSLWVCDYPHGASVTTTSYNPGGVYQPPAIIPGVPICEGICKWTWSTDQAIWLLDEDNCEEVIPTSTTDIAGGPSTPPPDPSSSTSTSTTTTICPCPPPRVVDPGPTCSGYCTYEWDGEEWIEHCDECEEGCECKPAPAAPGNTEGQIKQVKCQTTSTTSTTPDPASTTTAGPTSTSTTPKPCRCLPPTFCGGDCTNAVTYCSGNKTPPTTPQPCRTTSSSSTSSTSSTSTSTTTSTGTYAPGDPCQPGGPGGGTNPPPGSPIYPPGQECYGCAWYVGSTGIITTLYSRCNYSATNQYGSVGCKCMPVPGSLNLCTTYEVGCEYVSAGPPPEPPIPRCGGGCKWLCTDAGGWVSAGGGCQNPTGRDCACTCGSPPSGSCECGDQTTIACGWYCDDPPPPDPTTTTLCPGRPNPTPPPTTSSRPPTTTTPNCDNGHCIWEWDVEEEEWTLKTDVCPDNRDCECNNPPRFAGSVGSQCAKTSCGGPTSTSTTTSTTPDPGCCHQFVGREAVTVAWAFEGEGCPSEPFPLTLYRVNETCFAWSGALPCGDNISFKVCCDPTAGETCDALTVESSVACIVPPDLPCSITSCDCNAPGYFEYSCFNPEADPTGCDCCGATTTTTTLVPGTCCGGSKTLTLSRTGATVVIPVTWNGAGAWVADDFPIGAAGFLGASPACMAGTCDVYITCGGTIAVPVISINITTTVSGAATNCGPTITLKQCSPFRVEGVLEAGDPCMPGTCIGSPQIDFLLE
jgi:hypothetical protein